MCPRRGVHSIRDRMYFVAKECASGGFGMALRDAIDISAQTQRKLRHVEHVISAEALEFPNVWGVTSIPSTRS
jgi:hypothetical protein